MRFLLSCILLCYLTACGYNFPGRGELPGGVNKVFVPLFNNRTAEPLLENKLSRAVSEVFSRNKNMILVANRQIAQAELLGVITSYRTRAVSFDLNDDISEYRATMQVEARLVQIVDGRLLWQGTASWDDEYEAATDKALQEDLEQEAIEEISLRLAEELLYSMIDDF